MTEDPVTLPQNYFSGLLRLLRKREKERGSEGRLTERGIEGR